MIKQIRFILVFLVSFHPLYAQISLESNNLDISIKEELLMHDTSSFHLVQIPLLSFDIDMYSKPGIFTFFETTYNSILIDLESYNHHVDDFSIHLIDIQNSLFLCTDYPYRSLYGTVPPPLRHHLLCCVFLIKQQNNVNV